jgi:putative membrane protein
MTTRDLLLGAWHVDPLAVLVGLGVIVFWAASPGQPARPRVWFLAAGVGTVVVAVASPVGTLADGYLFSAHMLQHLLLVLVVPPLLLNALRDQDRGPIPAVRGPWLSVAWVMGVGAMWLWHEPRLCGAAAQSATVHRLQEISLLAMGTAFWWPLAATPHRRRVPPFAGIVYLFSACLACTVLGILVTFSPIEVCPAYAHPIDRLGVMPLLREEWGLTAQRDQQLGGLLMWVPACLVYGAAILGQLARWYRLEELPSAPSSPLEHA